MDIIAIGREQVNIARFKNKVRENNKLVETNKPKG